jgi:hypothetical protein
MKKFFIILFISFFTIACNLNPNMPVKKSAVVEETHKVPAVGKVKYVEFDGHQYVMWIGSPYVGSLCHSPNCPCLQEYKK